MRPASGGLKEVTRSWCGKRAPARAVAPSGTAGLLVVVLILQVGLGACRTEPSVVPGDVSVDGATLTDEQILFRNVHEDVGFVGSDACFSCHEDEWAGYQEHGMAGSYYPLTPESAVADFDGEALYHEGSGFYYRAYRDGEHYYQEEYRLDDEGRKTHRLIRRMDYVVGSGTAARTYLTENNGRLYELPLTWYTQKNQWGFSPGYELHNVRFDRLIPDRCMACHNGMPESVPFVEGKYSEVPHGIGCERCHGPGELHVDERLADPDVPGDIDSTIVNPIHLDLDRQLDVCQQCHLHGTVSVLREDRGPYAFRPSEPLAAHVALFSLEEPRRSDRIDVISHADRMKQSACFTATLETDRPMTCITCHDPHEGFRDKGPGYFNETCMSCHDPEALQAQFENETARRTHAKEANCFSCHMPVVAAAGAPHASFTDHWIRVVEEVAESSESRTAHEPPVLVPYFERDRYGTDGQRYTGMAYVTLGRQRGDTLALKTGIDLLENALTEDPEHGEAQFLLGFAYMLLGDAKKAIPALEESVRLDPDVPERLNALAQVYEAEGRDPTTISRLYRHALSIQPALADVRVNYGRFLETQSRLNEAMEQYRMAIEEQQWLEQAHYNLGTAYLQQGQFEQAESHLLQALELEPDYPEALGNLGLLYASQGRTDEAHTYFARAVDVAPDDPAALGNLGTFYLNEGDLDQAIELLERAVAAEPTYLDGLLNLALAHFRNDDMVQARRYAEQALRIDPTNARAQQLLAAL